MSHGIFLAQVLGMGIFMIGCITCIFIMNAYDTRLHVRCNLHFVSKHDASPGAEQPATCRKWAQLSTSSEEADRYEIASTDATP
jgi:hypothetical protein